MSYSGSEEYEIARNLGLHERENHHSNISKSEHHQDVVTLLLDTVAER
jgi:hypothetical protein